MSEECRRVPLSVWQRVVADHGAGAVIDGRVTSVVPFGAFIEVAEGVEGLLHESDWLARPKVGSVIRVRVARIDVDNRRLSLVEA